MEEDRKGGRLEEREQERQVDRKGWREKRR